MANGLVGLGCPARAAADGQDVRIGGGPTVVRDFVAAGLVDLMHLHLTSTAKRPS